MRGHKTLFIEGKCDELDFPLAMLLVSGRGKNKLVLTPEFPRPCLNLTELMIGLAQKSAKQET